MNINDIVASRIYSWIFQGETKLNKGGRAGIEPNPLYGRVTSRKVYAGQAATGDMYCNAQRKLNPAWEPSGDRAPTFEATDNPCVVRSLSSGDLQVRIIRPRTVKREFFVDNRLATEAEMTVIKTYSPVRKVNPFSVRIMFPYVHNLANVEGELTGEDSDD